uniref:Uncharacterized protein n=1 Tax=Arundo donax TaxID=35708 RepID=A0A0A9DNQ7_ARUDO
MMRAIGLELTRGSRCCQHEVVFEMVLNSKRQLGLIKKKAIGWPSACAAWEFEVLNQQPRIAATHIIIF